MGVSEEEFIDKLPDRFAQFRELRRAYINTFGYPPYAFRADVCEWVRLNAPSAEGCKRALVSVDRYFWD